MVYLENVILLLESMFMDYQTTEGMELLTCGMKLVLLNLLMDLYDMLD
jgi:hypothetical protein